MRIITYIALFLSVVLYSCKQTEDEIDLSKSTIEQELSPAKTFYANNGVTFKFRLYKDSPIEGKADNNNNQGAEIREIIENNGSISIVGYFVYYAMNIQYYGGLINCQGDYVSASNKDFVGVQNSSIYDDFEISPINQLVSYSHISSMFEGSYGYAGLSYHNHTLNTHNGPTSSSSVSGYMFQLNNQFFMLSMGFNSNYGHPTYYLYKPNPTDPWANPWIGSIITSMDFEQGTTVNVPATNHASKVGNSDKVFWAWLSYTTTFDNGKINIISYDGSSYSTVITLDGIGSIGKNAYVHEIKLYKNPTNLNNPYMVVRHNNTDILDIYKFNGTAIELVKKGVSIPNSIVITSGTTRQFKDLKFTGNNIYLITGKDKNLYKLTNNAFEIDRPNLTLENEKISAIESTSNGLLVSIVKTLLTTPQPKTVSDVVFIPN